MKQKIYILLLLTCITLLGTFLFQAHWLLQHYRSIQSQLEREIGGAVTIATEQAMGESAITLLTTIDGELEYVVKPYLLGKKKSVEGGELLPQIKIERLAGRAWHTKVDTLLRQEMEKIGITSFAYTYYDAHKGGLVLSTTFPLEDFEGEQFEYALSAQTVGLPNKLTVLIPGKQQIALERMLGSVAGATTLTFCTVFSLLYALRLIFSQKKVSEMRRDFINNLTHEFKTPIATVSLALEALLKFDIRKDDQKTVQYLEMAQKENKRLGVMVQKVLNIAASEKGTLRLQLEPLEMHQLLEEVFSQLKIQVEEYGGSLTWEFVRVPIWVYGDAIHLSNVMSNLLDNALKYSVKQPEIKVRTTIHQNELLISVEDTGIGIEKEYIGQVFDKFFRVPTGDIHNVKGFGLGLSYAAMVIQRHMGEITVNSEVGKGSVFTIHLPLLKQRIDEKEIIDC
ncbi:HAMP domain-containing sensor histidine kinase [Algivirga pacifica]|uniref:histidine kinase n=1 Tax=Algivirga pacifica TaxID=1162670 RepID=A0ABP9DFE0_9BACT